MPVAQIVAGFTKVFVGEIVEKGKFFVYQMPPGRTNYAGMQLVKFRRGVETKDRCLRTTYGRRIGCISKRRGVSARRGHYAANGSSRDKPE